MNDSPAKKKVVITGSTGLVGSALVEQLRDAGWTVLRAVRRPASDASEVSWDPKNDAIEQEKVEGVDAVVHLAGENISGHRWTDSFKQRILHSRTKGTLLVSEALAKLENPPRVFCCASAIGYYGDRGDELLVEDSPPGDDFLAKVCQQWEAACQPARDAGIRVVNTRIGVILSPDGGALKTMLTPFKLGAGGVLGSGRQYMSWVALDDVISAIQCALDRPQLSGPVNLTSPNPVTNREFTKTLGSVLSRPTIVPMPAFGARLAFGEMADALLLASTRVEPRELQSAGFEFRFPQLENALQHLLQ